MKTFSKKLDEILISFFNEVESDVHSGNNKDGIVYTKAGTKAKQSIIDLICDTAETIRPTNAWTVGTDLYYGFGEGLDEYKRNLINLIKGERNVKR